VFRVAVVCPCEGALWSHALPLALAFLFKFAATVLIILRRVDRSKSQPRASSVCSTKVARSVALSTSGLGLRWWCRHPKKEHHLRMMAPPRCVLGSVTAVSFSVIGRPSGLSVDCHCESFGVPSSGAHSRSLVSASSPRGWPVWHAQCYSATVAACSIHSLNDRRTTHGMSPPRLP